MQLPDLIDADVTSSLDELRRLVHTLGYEVVGTLSQKRPNSAAALVVGEGKLREVAEWTGGPGHVVSAVKRKKTKVDLRHEAEDDLAPPDSESEPDDSTGVSPESPARPDARADVVIFDGELSPSQLRNLESATGVVVLDRTGVIIEIFSRHARTRAARLQVEIARLTYLAPRIRETGGGRDREGGGIGGKGAGESSRELDRRRIRDRIKELKTELDAVQVEGGVRRQRRRDENAVALVGYTNAGKSSLMRAITGGEVLVADKLFATLDTTVRPMQPVGVPNVLISDTVGFIKRLPHDLVASFKSTLEEALNADLLLFVVDAADPAFRQHLEVTRNVLGDIGALEIESRLILNKRDRLTNEQIESLTREFPGALFLSTKNTDDLERLRSTLRAFFERGMIEAELRVPYATKGAIGEIRRRLRVLDETFDESGAVLRVRGEGRDLDRIRDQFKLV